MDGIEAYLLNHRYANDENPLDDAKDLSGFFPRPTGKALKAKEVDMENRPREGRNRQPNSGSYGDYAKFP